MTFVNYARAFWRYFVLMGVMLFCVGMIGRNLVSIQIAQHSEMLAGALSEYQSVVMVPPKRGTIYDRHGNVLIQNVPLTKVAAFPLLVPNNDASVDQVAKILGMPAPTLWTIIHTAQDKGGLYAKYTRITSGVNLDVANALLALHLPWLSLERRNTLAYPNGSLAANVLGFMNAQGQGQYGVEQAYDSVLSGTVVMAPAGTMVTPHDGASITLTLDYLIQHTVEDVLARTVKKTGADSGEAIFMDPHTGAILAMADSPTYDPNIYSRYQPLRYINNTISSQYEPGSTFKVLTVAAGIDSGNIMSTTTVQDSGQLLRYGFTITNWETGVGWGTETPLIMLRYSANVGAAQFAEKTGPRAFYHYIRAFGFGQPTGVDLVGEVPGKVRFPNDVNGWSLLDLDTNAYGQGLSVTPLQLITAVSAVANGGLLMRPYIVGQIKNGNQISTTVPTVVRRVLSSKSSATVTDILEQSAIDGEASQALIPGYGIAAKTGTAQRPEPGCNYSCNNGTIASLIGWAPAHNPRFIGLIILNHPRTSPWGSETAAPAFREIATQLFTLLGIAPNSPASQ